MKNLLTEILHQAYLNGYTKNFNHTPYDPLIAKVDKILDCDDGSRASVYLINETGVLGNYVAYTDNN